MSLSSLTLQRVLFVLVVRVVVCRLVAVDSVLLDESLLAFDTLGIHVGEHLRAQLDVLDEGVASVAGEVLADHDPKHLEAVCVWRHGVGGDDPAADAQLVSKGELVKDAVLIGLQAEGDEGKTLAGLLGHDDEVHGFQGVGEVVCCPGEVGHDGSVAVLAEPNKLVVLANDLRGAL